MNRLVVVSARSLATAAPKTTTGIEHAEKAKQRAGGKPEWSLYKCDDYLKFDKYSYAHAEITMNKDRVPQPTNRKADELPKMSNIELTIDGLTELFTGSTENILQFFTNWCDTNRDEKVFDGVTVDVKKFLADKMDESLLVPELTDILLVTIRILCRDKRGVDSLLQPKICEKVLKFAGLPISEDVKFTETSRMEAQKCLVNTMFNSAVMPRLFYSHKENTAHLMSYLTDFEPSRRSASKMEWIRDFSEEKVPEAWFLYAKIAFIATAKSGDYQQKLAQVPDMVDALVVPISMVIPPKSREREMTPMDIMTANEALRTFFNIYCHFEGVVPTLTGPNAATASRVLRDIICSSDFSPHDQISQSAIHALAVPPLPIVLRVLCSDPEKELPEEGKEGEKVEYTDMRFTEAMLRHAEHRMDLIFRLITEEHPSENPSEAIALLGPYFQVLTRMCMESKYVRRYCRMKILPPLTAEEVQKRPEDNDNYRGKLAKMMTMATSTKDIIGQFIYVICKRNVSRMIKYVGFGHCAGHLANFGLLGQLNQPKRASDSEDSETDDYNAVRDSVNPVTGALYPPDRGSVLDSMSPEQREFEAMKLVEAIDRMMEAGIVKPGTIGEDGKVREVSHVLELIKNAPEPQGSDSDSD